MMILEKTPGIVVLIRSNTVENNGPDEFLMATLMKTAMIIIKKIS